MLRFLFPTLLSLLLFTHCSSDDTADAGSQTTSETIELTDGWARPAAKGRSSAIYLGIHNQTSSQDTIIGVSSEAAGIVEIHESFKGENGIIEMRPADTQIIKSGSELYFRPNGVHIMLMELQHDLPEGDSLNITLEFAQAGSATTTIPVKMQN